MIVVRNTRELEENYDLNSLPEEEQIRVIGGMHGKSKYEDEKYERRTTYSVRQLRQIIYQMEEIERNIPEDWNQWQRAKYIYEVLGKNIGYNLDTASYGRQDSSNLQVIMSRKGICAGYSLLFKEMMDRQEIECDYVRGVATLSNGRTEKHAWNVLTIDGVTFPIDLTWDSARLNQGISTLQYFGNNREFFQEHNLDFDEKAHKFSLINAEFVKSIDTNVIPKEQNFGIEEKKAILAQAIQETYQKYSDLNGKQVGQNQVSTAVMRFIKEELANGFTRQGNARENIQNAFNNEEMLDIVITGYLDKFEKLKENSKGIFENAISQNLVKYGEEQAQQALRTYILEGSTQGFTRQGNARENIELYVNREEALKTIIDCYVNKEIEKITQNKKYFNASEFDNVSLPEEKKGILSSAANWIRGKVVNRNRENNTEEKNIIKSNDKEER